MKRKILFVDDDTYVLKSIDRMMRTMRNEWDIILSDDPFNALKLLSESAVDVVVTELRLSGMSGIEFLIEAKNRFPKSVRIIFSGYHNRDVILESVGLAHQFISKPSDNEEIKKAIRRAFMIKNFLENEALNGIISNISSLPSLPDLYVQLMEELNSEESSIERVSDIIGRDLGMTAKVLQLVNSAFFGFPQEITSPQKAVALLGFDLIKAIVLTTGVFSTFTAVQAKGFDIQALWDHGFKTAGIAKMIAQTERMDKKSVDFSFMGGLLHDVGKILIAANFPVSIGEILDVIIRKNLNHLEAEQEVLGATHAHIGAYLLGIWGLPEEIIESAAYHHNPDSTGKSELSPLTLVHIADCFEHAKEILPDLSKKIEGVDHAYLKSLGMEKKYDLWRKKCSDILDLI